MFVCAKILGRIKKEKWQEEMSQFYFLIIFIIKMKFG